MTNKYLKKELKDIYQNVLDELQEELGEAAYHIYLGHIKDGDAIPRRVRKNEKFMDFVEKLISLKQEVAHPGLSEEYLDCALVLGIAEYDNPNPRRAEAIAQLEAMATV